MTTRLRSWLTTALTLAAGACGDAWGEAGSIASTASASSGLSAGAAERFDGSAPSLEALGRGVLHALAQGDTLALERFRLTEREHNEVVWPELPASRPEVGFPLDYAWMNIQNRNRRSLDRIVPLYRGRDVELKLVDCRGDTQRFATFEVRTDCWVVFEVRDQGALYEAQVFKDVLVRGGGHKVFRYYEEEPRRVSGDGVERVSMRAGR